MFRTGARLDLGNSIQVFVAIAKVTVTDGNAIEIATEDLTDLHRCIAVRDLGGVAIDERAMSAKLGHAGFERAAGAGGREEEQHRQHFVAQVGMRFAQGALALQIPGYIQNGFDFLFGEVQVADQITTTKICLHCISLL